MGFLDVRESYWRSGNGFCLILQLVLLICIHMWWCRLNRRLGLVGDFKFLVGTVRQSCDVWCKSWVEFACWRNWWFLNFFVALDNEVAELVRVFDWNLFGPISRGRCRALILKDSAPLIFYESSTLGRLINRLSFLFLDFEVHNWGCTLIGYNAKFARFALVRRQKAFKRFLVLILAVIRAFLDNLFVSDFFHWDHRVLVVF